MASQGNIVIPSTVNQSLTNLSTWTQFSTWPLPQQTTSPCPTFWLPPDRHQESFQQHNDHPLLATCHHQQQDAEALPLVPDLDLPIQYQDNLPTILKMQQPSPLSQTIYHRNKQYLIKIQENFSHSTCSEGPLLLQLAPGHEE